MDTTSTHLPLQQILMRLTLLPVLAASLIGLVRFRHLPPNLRYLAAGVGFFLLPMGLLGLLLLVLHRNNLFLMPIYTLGELGILAAVYHRTLHSVFFTRLMLWLTAGFASYAVVDLLAATMLTRFRPGQQVLQSVLILAMVGFYFRQLLNELQVKRLWQEPMFWVSAGLCIYFLGYLQIALFSNYLLRYSRQLNMNIWAVHSLLFIVLYLCYCRALWVSPKS
ncbi:hypothetical protein SAMN02745146_2764 [Hymenobacter daecheongensis DSM 21074]|uniref:YhhN-like protein n=1 Tax=Hymenobacter daecheongensis DSM 21074 TaxID=1121955 RepID=A0A1M6I2I6_9BACT|nr:hypothetical protein [Hymenobacter daecheongensis]SHJ28689.1 hypothetical protein SAMN02745146_2764 [Hymenobacter daecheongensis DSM 21074]